MSKKLYRVTIPTTGYVTYEVKAECIEDVRELIENGKAQLIEESSGDWSNEDEWEIEEEDENA
jgi:hypothetical protein